MPMLAHIRGEFFKATWAFHVCTSYNYLLGLLALSPSFSPPPIVKVFSGKYRFIMPAPAHVQADTLDRFIAGWRKWTPEDWMATWSSDCVQVMLPLSLGIPPKSVGEVKGILPKLMEIVTNYEVRGSLNA